MLIAFVPARGGSKSIPLKNIKSLHGKPLIYWSLKALQHTENVDKIVVATDSSTIAQTVLKFSFPKVEVFIRNEQNASDIASTESVMLEYIEKESISDQEDFMLVQCTSPLTSSDHFVKGISLYYSSDYDSVLSTTIFKRFLWTKEGEPINYDPKARPRRQDFDGCLIENGAFYINRVGNIKRDRNRLSGNIGTSVMPEYTMVELDEPDDWLLVENLMKRYLTN